MKNVLILVFLSMWMATPIQAETKVIRPAKFIWTIGTNTPAVIKYAIYIIQEGTTDPIYLGMVPSQGLSSGTSLSRSYKEKFSVVVAGVNSSNQRGIYSDSSPGVWSTYPNFDYNGSGCVDTSDFSIFKQDYFTMAERSDANLDHHVDSIDFSAFKSVYGKCIVGGRYQ